MSADALEQPKPGFFSKASDAWSDLALTLPIFIAYHLGVVFLPIRNAADIVTAELVKLADNSMLLYAGITLLIGAVFVGVLILLGRKQTLEWQKFVYLLGEAILYAVAMRLIAGWVVGKLTLVPVLASGGSFGGAVMSAGAGFYEEITFRVGLFGIGLKLLKMVFPLLDPLRSRLLGVGWAVLIAAVFSGWHYVGPLGDPFELRSFVFRWVCGLVFTAVYVFRGFAPTVWTHTVYDLWVLVF